MSSFCLQPSSSLKHEARDLYVKTNKESCEISLCRLHLPLFLSLDEFGEVGVQLALLVDPPLLQAVPPLLLGYPQSARDVVAEVQPLLLRQVISWETTKQR